MKKIIDLTLEIYDGMPGPPQVVPTTMFYSMQFVTHDFSAPNYKPPMQGFAENILIMAEHVGTHVDVPFHTDKKGITLEKAPLEKFIGDAVLVDVSYMKKFNEPVTYDLLEQAIDDQKLRIKEGDIALVRIWPGKWGEKGFYKCEGFTMDSVNWLKEKKIKTLGTNLAMIDFSGDLRCPTHSNLLPAGIPLIENLINLENIPEKRFQFIGLPLKIKGGTGSPIRAVAII